MFVCLQGDLWSSQRNEPQQIRIIALRTRDQVKAYSEILSCN